MTVTAPTAAAALSPWQDVLDRVARGDRFAGLTAVGLGYDNSKKRLSAYLARAGGIDIVDVTLPPDAASYPALTPHLKAAFWYERLIHDETDLVPGGHPRLAPLVKPGDPGDYALPRHVDGYGLFTIPHGPVRSGVFESMEYLVETPGEAIPHLNMRIFYKHRAIAARFAGASVADGVLLAERAEGTASVAHALAFCHAVESLSDAEIPRDAALIRVVHAELERIANHLDVATRLADAAGLAVATARFAVHKEKVLRLIGALCGSRFGRGVVVPGGVSGPLGMTPGDLMTVVGALEKAIMSDAESLMGTSSFLDRLRGTGPLTPDRAREHGALGPIGKASGYADDARIVRPYDAYDLVSDAYAPREHRDGDALARLRVRWDEADRSFTLVRQAVAEVARADGSSPERSLVVPAYPVTSPGGSRHPPPGPLRDGRAVGWAEAPQGEVVYDVTIADGRIAWCQPRSPSFHNLVLMHEVFKGDILTDFPFIEASFGLSVAGAAL
jgi:Ni,Fe-hydrogenase III large subunit